MPAVEKIAEKYADKLKTVKMNSKETLCSA